MALRINFNYAANSAQRNLRTTQEHFTRQVERLSSGLRINRAADDAAGLAVSEKLKNQVRGLNQAQRNAQDGISLLQTAEGALKETHNLLARMRELAIQAANDTLTAADRDHLQNEVNQLISEVDRIGRSTQFNKIQLLDGSRATAAGAIFLHVGANKETSNGANRISFNINSMLTSALGDLDGSGVTLRDGTATYADTTTVANTLVINTRTDANEAINILDQAIEQVSEERARLGAIQNRLEHTITSLSVASENTAAANSRIVDADIAAAVSEMVRTQILQQSGISVLAQANQAPQAVLQLLR